jgi:hypothetical protein
MSLGGQRPTPDISRPREMPAPQLEGKKIDLESLLSLAAIRQHTKIDDVPHVTDEQLTLYRKAAFEVCEKYTGRIFCEHKVIVEDVSTGRSKRWRPTYKHRLRHASADGVIYLYGSAYGMADRTFNLSPGTQEITIEVMGGAYDAAGCCGGPHSSREVSWGMKVMYRAGIASAADVPAGIILGVLKFIAWCIQNPGDEIMTVRNRENKGEQGIIGTNNGAWASGAIEQWRIFVDDAI